MFRRDLKPQNLLVNKDWRCKVCSPLAEHCTIITNTTQVADFGVSTVKFDGTRTMTCIGTPIYMYASCAQLGPPQPRPRTKFTSCAGHRKY